MVWPRLRLVVVWVLLLTAVAGGLPAASMATETDEVEIAFFWGDGCPHCAAEHVFLDDLTQRHPQVRVKAYEVWYDEANRQLFFAVAAQHGVEPDGVPATFMAGRAWIGFNDQIAAEIEATVLAELERLAPAPSAPPPSASPQTRERGTSLDLPLLGEVRLADQSLLVSTALIALVDGFNPCSLWVMSVLLAMMIHSGSRRRIAAVGVTFLLVTATAYALFIAGIASVLSWAGHLSVIQTAVAILVLLFAAVAIKDYFWMGRGPSFSIPDRFKPGIYRDSRDLIDGRRRLLPVLGGTVVLAAGVALMEMPCTAGFPMLWSGMLAERGVGGGEFAGLLGLYLLIYLLDELLVFGAVLVTLRATKLQERHGRVLKLVAGMVMLFLAVTLIAAPEVMNSVTGALGVFGAALAATAAVLVVHRRWLPALGA